MGISVTDGNHDAVTIDAVDGVCLLTQFQNAHFLHQFQTKAFFLCIVDNGCPIVRSIADMLLLAILFVPSAEHICLCRLGIWCFLPYFLAEECAKPFIDNTHGLQFLVSLFLFGCGLEI